MDDLRRSLRTFDPDAPLPNAPDPWHDQPMPEVRQEPPWAMAEMIATEPALAVRIGRRTVADGSARLLAGLIREAAGVGAQVLATGCGTSEHAAMASAAILRDAWRRAGLSGPGPVAAQAFELSLDPPGSGLVIGCSHEGGTAATIAALDAARDRGARTALITASTGAPAATGRDLVVATRELDQSWCHTVGYVSPITVAAVVAGELAGDVPQPGAIGRRITDGIEAAHAGTAEGEARPDEAIASSIAGATRLLVVASGADRVTARELALKVEEAAWLPAVSRDLETFLHGHLPATDASTALMLVLLECDGLDTRTKRARQALRAAAAVGMRPAAILGAEAASGIPAELTPAGRIVVPESAELPGAAGTLLGAAAPLQLVTLAIAAARGTNPDPIRRDDPTYLRAAELADDPAG
jgi:glucosamine 6-phosphate synthetase-like amidotransferase/phosphosugar isomerase protein